MRARFETFEEARERIGHWVKHYNHRRPHQGLDGMCPADRFFSIQKELRATIERGVGGERGRTGAAGQARGAVLHGGPDGRPERGDRDGQETHERAVDGKALSAGSRWCMT